MLTDTTVEILKKARALVEKGWTQWASRRTADDGSVSFCMTGALEPHDIGSGLGCGACAANGVLKTVTGVRHVPNWNDAPGRTQAEVLAAFDKAIELAERSNG